MMLVDVVHGAALTHKHRIGQARRYWNIAVTWKLQYHLVAGTELSKGMSRFSIACNLSLEGEAPGTPQEHHK